MQIILLERIHKLGQMGDVVTVKDGFARNFLLPQKKALRSTKANLEHFQVQRVHLEARNLELKTEAQAVAAKLDGQSFIVIRQAGDTGQLYGSVSTRDIADAVSAGGFKVDRGQVFLDKPIKNLGVHEVRVSLHPEVVSKITMNVARSADEAARQAKGEDVTAVKEEMAEFQTFSEDSVFEEGARKSESQLAAEAEGTGGVGHPQGFQVALPAPRPPPMGAALHVLVPYQIRVPAGHPSPLR